jgi:hypothetical protein
LVYKTPARPPPSKPGTRSRVIQARSQPSRCSPTGSVPWASYRLTPQQIDWIIDDEATALPDSLVRPPAWSKSVEEQMKILGEQMKEEPKVERGEPTSGLEPLTCSLRVIGRALLGFAQGCKTRRSEGFPFSGLLCVAPYCALGGVNSTFLWPARTSVSNFPPPPKSRSRRRSGPPGNSWL